MYRKFTQISIALVVCLSLLASSFVGSQPAVADEPPTPTRVPEATETPTVPEGASLQVQSVQADSSLATTQSTSTTRGIDAQSFNARFYNAPHLLGTPSLPRPYTQPIVFSLTAEGSPIHTLDVNYSVNLPMDTTTAYSGTANWWRRRLVRTRFG